MQSVMPELYELHSHAVAIAGPSAPQRNMASNSITDRDRGLWWANLRGERRRIRTRAALSTSVVEPHALMTTAPGIANAQPNVLAGDESHNKWDLADHEHVTLEAIL